MIRRQENEASKPKEKPQDIPVTAQPAQQGKPFIAHVGDTPETKAAKDDNKEITRQFLRNKGVVIGWD